MAENQVNINLSLLDQQSTIKKRTAEVENLNNQLDKTQKLASGGIPATGTKTGAQALRATEAPDSTVRLQRTVVTTGLQDSRRDQTRPQIRRATYGDSEDYAMAGGITGRGGASARDFADEARGLGGLVRLYATWAANIFAVSAAFTTLREAMQTDMLLKGLDQLGASSGIALGGLAKQFAATTDGAISLRTAAEMTAKAVSSGLSPEQLLDLGKVAKGASQALGVNMEDAVSRLTRGIVKLEPELLDELGLFTKTGKAAEEYARMVGKSESQLSDFERRQAFANAVLKEGKDKFGEIAQAGNPYDQLLASFKNVAQDILTVVNAVIGPVAKFLANNTELIGIAIAATVAKITTQAIPALTQWQVNLQKTADIAKQKAVDINQSFAKNLYDTRVAQSEVPKLQKELENQYQKLGFAAAAGFKNLSPAERKNLEEGIKTRERTISEITERIAASEEFQREGARGRAQKVAAANAARTNLIAELPTIVGEQGLGRGLVQFYSKVSADKDIQQVGRFGTFVKGTFVALAAEGAILGRAFAAFLPALQIAGLVLYGLEALFSKNAKEVKILGDAVSSMEESTKTATNTMEKFMGVMSPEAVVAVSNNFNSLTKSLGDSAKAFKEFEKASSGFDKFMETYKGSPLLSGATGAATGALIGSYVPVIGTAAGALLGGAIGAGYGLMTKGEKTQAAEGVADLLVQSIKSAPEGEIKDNLSKKVSQALGGTKLDKKSMQKFLEGADDLGSVIDRLKDIFQVTDSILQQSKVFIKNVEESTKKQVQSYQTLANSVRDNSPLTVFLMDTLNRTQSIVAAFGDVLAARASLESLSQTGPALVGLSGNDLTNMQNIISNYDIIILKEKDLTKEIKKRKEEFEKTTGKTFEDFAKTFDTKLKVGKARPEDAEFEAIRAQESRLKDFEAQIQQLSNQAADIAQSTVSITMGKMMQAHELMMKKTALEAERGLLSLTGQTVTSARIETQINKEIIRTELALVNINRDLIMQLELNRISTEQLKDAQLLIYYNEKLRDSKLDNDQRKLIEQQVSGLNKKLQTYGGRTAQTVGGIDIAGTEMVDSSEVAKQIAGFANRGDARGLEEFINRTGATAYQSMLPMIMKTAEDRRRAGMQLAAEDVKGIVKETERALAEEYKNAESSYKLLSTNMSAFAQAIGGGFGQTLNNFAATVKDNLDLKKIDDQITAQQKILESAAPESTKIAAKAYIDTLNTQKTRLTTEQNLNQIIRDRNAEIQINIDKTKALSDASIAGIEAQMRLINTSTAAGMQQAEEMRQRIVQERLAAESRVFQIQTADMRGRISELAGERAKAMQEGGIGGYAFDQSQQGQELSKLQRALAGQEEIRGMTTGAAAVREISEQRMAGINQALKSYDELIARENLARGLEQQRFDINQNFLNSELQRNQQRLQFEQSLGLLTGQEIQNRTLLQEKANIDLDLQTQLRNITNELTAAELVYQRVKRSEELAGRAGISETGDYVSSPELDRAKGELDAAKLRAEAAGSAARAAASANKSFLDEQANVSDRQKAYAAQFNQAFQGMAQSIIDFAKTGKLEFKSLITSLIEGLIKYELQLQMTAMYSATVRPLLFGGAKAIGTAVMSAFTGTPTPTAMGAAYSGGIKSYAMGGTFTNQIVNKPTLFKAANGLGLMGEAGPEAIMPLQRDSRGRLGVSGGSNDVSVVVNNYGKERAEVKESTDGRGNRRIEVVVGEMVAGEMTRVGSPLQQTFTNNYGLAMPVGRR
jgi:lambda family phage tail tape measure protein